MGVFGVRVKSDKRGETRSCGRSFRSRRARSFRSAALVSDPRARSFRVAGQARFPMALVSDPRRRGIFLMQQDKHWFVSRVRVRTVRHDGNLRYGLRTVRSFSRRQDACAIFAGSFVSAQPRAWSGGAVRTMTAAARCGLRNLEQSPADRPLNPCIQAPPPA